MANSPRSQTPSKWHLALLVVCFGVVAVAIAQGLNSADFLQLQARLAGSDTEFDRYATKYHDLVGQLNGNETCLPIHVQNINHIGLFYQHCSPLAVSRNGEAKKVTENFTVPAPVAQRFNFWRKVYGIYGKDQYALHLSHYSEVVLEVADASTIPGDLNDVQRAMKVKKLLKTHRERYRPIFRAMHKYRNQVHRYTPTMRRIAAAMAHIDSPNKYIDSVWKMRLQRGQRDFIAEGIPRSQKYMSKIEQEFIAAGIPVEISQLAFVESSFNMKARSKVGASGVYQIMPATGKQYMIIRNGVDERNDPLKSARAATKLLNLNYKILGEWPLAITAYNHGVGGIKRAVRKVGSSDINELIQNYEGRAFGFASKNFFTSFLAVLYTLQHQNIYYPDAETGDELSFVEHKLTRWLKVSTIAKKHGVSTKDLAEYNPDISRTTLRRDRALPKGFVVKIPVKQPIADDSSPEQNSRLIQLKEDRG